MTSPIEVSPLSMRRFTLISGAVDLNCKPENLSH